MCGISESERDAGSFPGKALPARSSAVRLLRTAREGEPARAGARLADPLRQVIESVVRGFPDRLVGLSGRVFCRGTGAQVRALALLAEQAEELDRFGVGGAEPVRYAGVELGRFAG